jgi:DNA-binding SARP family transcriptional activator
MRISHISDCTSDDACVDSAIQIMDSPPRDRPIRIRTFGGLSVRVAQAPMLMRARPPQRELDLLSALVAGGPHGVDFRALAIAVWPDAEDGAAKNCCAVTANRLRRRLGRADAVTLANGRMRLESSLVSADAWEFDQVIAQWEVAISDGDAQVAMWMARAFRLYVGEFIP